MFGRNNEDELTVLKARSFVRILHDLQGSPLTVHVLCTLVVDPDGGQQIVEGRVDPLTCDGGHLVVTFGPEETDYHCIDVADIVSITVDSGNPRFA